jgi:hypothetical protein
MTLFPYTTLFRSIAYIYKKIRSAKTANQTKSQWTVKVKGLLRKRFPWGLPTNLYLCSTNSLEGADVEDISLLSPSWVALNESEASSSSLTLKAAEVRSTPKAPRVPSVLKSAEHNS